MKWVDRLMGRSVRDLAEEVDAALGRLAAARGLEAQARDALDLALNDVARAERGLREARDALFTEHPDLAPDGWKDTPTMGPGTIQHPDGTVIASGDNPLFETVTVDDENDPRFASGAVTVSPSDDADLPPVVWAEHDG